MWPDWVLNPGPVTNESGALPTALRGPATPYLEHWIYITQVTIFRIIIMVYHHRKKKRECWMKKSLTFRIKWIIRQPPIRNVMKN